MSETSTYVHFYTRSWITAHGSGSLTIHYCPPKRLSK